MKQDKLLLAEIQILFFIIFNESISKQDFTFLKDRFQKKFLLLQYIQNIDFNLTNI
jgi:hypothetical protein